MGNYAQFYYTNQFKDATITTADSTVLTNADNMLDGNDRVYASSVGSADATTESWVLTISEAVSIDTIFLLGNNLKTAAISYYDGSWNTAESITVNKENKKIDLGSTKTGVTAIRIVATHTDAANLEKRVAQFIGTLLNFELAVPPEKIIPGLTVNASSKTNIDGQFVYHKMGQDMFTAEMAFKNLGSSGSETDFTNIYEFIRTREAFLLLLCGDTERSRRPYTFGDLKEMCIMNTSVTNAYSAGCDTAGDTVSILMKELV